MKLIPISTIAFLILTPIVFSELTVEDIEKIGSVVKESETRVKEHVDLKIEHVNVKIDEMDKRLNQTWALVIALIALVVIAVGIPFCVQKKLKCPAIY